MHFRRYSATSSAREGGAVVKGHRAEAETGGGMHRARGRERGQGLKGCGEESHRPEGGTGQRAEGRGPGAGGNCRDSLRGRGIDERRANGLWDPSVFPSHTLHPLREGTLLAYPWARRQRGYWGRPGPAFHRRNPRGGPPLPNHHTHTHTHTIATEGQCDETFHPGSGWLGGCRV